MKKILIFKSDRLGDFINISSLIKNLKIKFPDSKIYIFCSKYNSKIANYYKEIDNILIYEDRLIFFLLKFYKFIFLNKFDLILQLDGKKNSYLYALLARSQLKACICFVKNKNFLGFTHKSIRPNIFYKFFFKNTVNCIENYNHHDNKAFHYLTLYQKLLEQLNIKIEDKKHYLPFLPDKNTLFNDYILFHIDRRWDLFDKVFLENFVQKIVEINLKHKIVFTSNYEGNNFFKQLINRFLNDQNIKFVHKSSINDLLNIIYYSHTIVSSHTGFVVHAGSAFNKNIIDIVNINIDKELDRWIPFDINYKRVFFDNLSELNI